MSGFLRPGQKRPAAFGISFDSDRDQAATAATVYNSREHLALQDQRSRLPVYKHRKELLYLVETHATSLIVGETGSGKTTQTCVRLMCIDALMVLMRLHRPVESSV